MTKPFVSVVVPVYNGQNQVDDCLSSLIEQTYPSDCYEIIVVDNASTDGTASLVNKYDVKLVREEHPTSYAARNAGVVLSKGEIIAFTDVDCVTSRTWLSNAVAGFDAQDVGAVGGKIVGLQSDDDTWVERILQSNGWLSQQSTLEDTFMPYPQTANAFYRKSVFDTVGYFEPDWLSGGDADLAWRMQLKLRLRIQYVPDAIVYHKHRSDLRALYRQCVKWGYGQATLHVKYNELYREVYDTWRGSKMLSRCRTIIMSIVRALVHYIMMLAGTRGSKESFQYRLFDTVVASGMFVGYLRGLTTSDTKAKDMRSY